MKICSSLILVLSLFFCSIANAELSRVLIDDALATAEEEATARGYDVKEMGIMLQINDLPSFIYSEGNRFVTSGPKYDLINALKGKEYLSVYYKPHGNNSDDGDICIAIDAETGKRVLGIYEGRKHPSK